MYDSISTGANGLLAALTHGVLTMFFCIFRLLYSSRGAGDS